MYKAGKQIAAGGVPGIVLLDATWHCPFTGWEDGVREALTKPETASVAAVLIHCSFRREQWPYHAFYALPGPAIHAIGDKLDSVFHTCDHNHLHFEPLRPPGPHDCLL
ncbi:MAG: hypothetical protein ABMA64_08345 [Myxococcota bacterium]